MNNAQTISTLVRLGLSSIVMAMVMGCSDPRSSGKTLMIEIKSGRFGFGIENKGSPEAAGKMVDVYINEGPPNGFKHPVVFPEFGQTVDIYLDAFEKSDGTRFSPSTAVRDVWVGGNGYDFVQHSR